MNSLLVLCAILFAPVVRADAPRPHVYLVIVDGFDATLLNAKLTPNLWRLAMSADSPTTFYPRGRSVLPTVTNTNHAAVLTASYPAANGIVANRLWETAAADTPARSEFARYLEVETLFTVIETDRPVLTTAALFGKSRLGDLFEASPGRQKRPDILWGDAVTETESFDPVSGFSSDQRTMDEALATAARADPDFLVVALPDVDRTEHRFGPHATETQRALRTVDREIERLVEFARGRESWTRTIFMVTADHGFRARPRDLDGKSPMPKTIYEAQLARAGLPDVRLIASGSLALLSRQPRALAPAGAAGRRLKEIRAKVLAQAGVAEAWYLRPNPADGGSTFTLAHAHPEWRFVHPRAGEMVLVAQANCAFAEASAGVRPPGGDHGGPGESYIPILIAGGYPRIRAQVIGAAAATRAAENPDLGATAAWLLGVRRPRRIGGGDVSRSLAGRVLREAFSHPTERTSQTHQSRR